MPRVWIHVSGFPLVLDLPLASWVTMGSLLLVSSWSFSFLICKMGIIVVLNLELGLEKMGLSMKGT